jgi:hypothetical protein
MVALPPCLHKDRGYDSFILDLLHLLFPSLTIISVHHSISIATYMASEMILHKIYPASQQSPFHKQFICRPQNILFPFRSGFKVASLLRSMTQPFEWKPLSTTRKIC